MKRLMKKSVAALTAITLAVTPVIAFAEEAAPSAVFADEEAMEIDMETAPAVDEEITPAEDAADQEETDNEAADDEEIVGETEMVLEDESAAARIALMSSIIDNAVEAHQDEGIYAALNSAFDALDANAAVFTDAETGRSEMNGDVIIETLYDSLDTHFDGITLPA